MTNYAQAKASLEEYSRGRALGSAELAKAARDYHTHIETHTQLQLYIQDAGVLIEALAGYFHQVIVPRYRLDAPAEPGDEQPLLMLLDSLILLCAETAGPEGGAGDAVSPECQNRRVTVRKQMHEALLCQISEALIRRGVSASYDATRAECVQRCAVLTRCLGCLDNQDWLKAARLTIECMESPAIRAAGVAALGVMCKSKLSLGRNTKALVVTHELTLSVSALIDIFHDAEEYQDPKTVQNARYCLSVILQLLQDEDRGPNDRVEWSTFLAQLLDSRFVAEDESELFSGLCFLNLLYTGATPEFVTYVTAAGLVLRVLPLVTKTEHRPLRVRIEALTFLTNAMDYPVLRESLLSADSIDMLTPMVTTDVKVDDVELQSAVLAVLSKLSLHGTSTRELLIDTVPFWSIFHELAARVESGHPDKARISDHLLVVLSSLSFNAEFKGHALERSMEELAAFEAKHDPEALGGDGGTKEHPLVKADSQLDRLVNEVIAPCVRAKTETRGGALSYLKLLSANCDEARGRFHIVLTVFNLLRSAHDKQFIKKDKNAPDFDADQLKELEMIYEKLPETAKIKDRLQYRSGGLLIALAARKKVLLDGALVRLLVKLTTTGIGRAVPSLVNMAAQAVRFLSAFIALRPQLVSQGGITLLLKNLEHDTENHHTRFTLASIVATVRPESFSYQMRLGCTHQALIMVDTGSEELHVHFAARALVNLTSSFEDVALRVFDGGKGWRRLEAILTDWSDSTSAYGAEIMCNICAHGVISVQIAELVEQQKMPWTFALLFAYGGDGSNVARQLASLAALSYLTRVSSFALWIASGKCKLNFSNKVVPASERLIELWFETCADAERGPEQLRLTVSLLNVFLYSLEGQLRDFCQRFVLSVGLAWSQTTAETQRYIQDTLRGAELTAEETAFLKDVVATAPRPEIRELWQTLRS